MYTGILVIMNKNMNNLDRRVRAMLVAPAAVVVGILIGPASAVAIVLYAIAAIMLATSAIGYCPLYSVLHLGRHSGGPVAR
jgi:hypothetical protein